MYVSIILNNARKRKTTFFAFLLFSSFFYAQSFIRISDEKAFDSVILFRKGKTIELNKSNFKDFSFHPEDKIQYNNKLLDFSVSQDSLFFFYKVKEIEEVHLTSENVHNKSEKTIKSKVLKHWAAAIFPNNLWATFIKIDTQKRTFVKSVIFFPEPLSFPHSVKGKLDIQILPSVNGMPDNDNPILTFQKDIFDASQKKWEIILPRIIKYPDNGFFVTFYYQYDYKEKLPFLKLNQQTYLYNYYPQTDEWKKSIANGYLYKLKVLQ